MGLVKGCPSTQLRAVPAMGWCPSLHWGLAVNLSTSLVGLQIIPVQLAKAHTWLKALSSLSLGCGHFARRPDCSVPLFQHSGGLLSPHRSLSSPCSEHGDYNAFPFSHAAPPLPPWDRCWARTELMDPLQGHGMAGPMVHRAGGRARRDTSLSVDRASTQREWLPHGGRSEGLLLGYFFNIF